MMDTSETYIKVCQKAGEIQGQCKPAIGEWFCWKPTGQVDIIRTDVFADIAQNNIGGSFIWLPRQDQLQEMLGNYDDVLGYWQKITWHWWHDEDGEFHNSNIDIKKYLGKFTSMEQLWLAFVMSEKYNKVWDSEDWVKE